MLSKIRKEDIEKSKLQIHGAGQMVSATFSNSVIEQLESEIKELKKALAFVNDDQMHYILDWVKCGICHNSPTGSQGRKDRMEKFNTFRRNLESARHLIKK